MVPTLVPKPGSPTVTQGNLPSHVIAALPALGLRQVMLDHEICSLKIRVSVVRWTRFARQLLCLYNHDLAEPHVTNRLLDLVEVTDDQPG